MKRWLLVTGLTCFLVIIAAGTFTNISGQSATVGGNAGSGDAIIKEPWVDARAYTSLNAAVAALGAANTTLVVSDAQTLTASLTIPTNISLVILKGGSITTAGDNTLTINGPFQAGLYQVFAGNGKVTFGRGTVNEVYPEWWYSGSGSWHTAFQNAVHSSGSVFAESSVKLSAKTYDITDGIMLDKHSISLIGSGPDATILNFNPTIDGKVLLNCTRSDSQVVVNHILKNFSITAQSNRTNTKIGIRWTDMLSGTIENVAITRWTGNGSIGLQLRGRNSASIGKISIAADRPIVVEHDPNLPGDPQGGVEYYHFYDTYLTALDPTQDVFHMDDGVVLHSTMIDGSNVWTGGKNGFYSYTTIPYPFPRCTSKFKLSNIVWNSPGAPGGYFVFIRQRNNQLTFRIKIENLYLGEKTNGANGFLFDDGVAQLLLTNCVYLGTGTGISLNGADAVLISNDIRGTVSLAGMTEMLSIKNPVPAYLPHFAVYQRVLRNLP